MRILLAEDEPDLANWLARALERDGLLTDWVSDGRDVLPSLAARSYDALVLDLGLPGLDGHQVLAALRARDERLPVLILTARDSLRARVGTLNQGADDFLAKPFDLAELQARLHALIRRARGSAHWHQSCGPLAWDATTKGFALHGQPLALTPREHAVLRVLIQHLGEPLSKTEILDRVVSDAHDVSPEAVEVLVHRLRKRLDGRGVRITTLRGLGYVLEPAP
ncbi:MAG: response regulator [Burkholderiaceae bacterium]|mgnify:FL=1|nr:response regulator [Pseudomonadota bacterium]MBS0599132.1 response regulator [Pseudomonadota bacterium]MCP5218069.1 response regulator [Burkholderiaceae bacterium]